jgi:predicted transcriptional regulator
MNIKRDVPMKILLTADQRRMLEWLSGKQSRSMNDVVRLAIERVYQDAQMRLARTAAVGETIKPRSP